MLGVASIGLYLGIRANTQASSPQAVQKFLYQNFNSTQESLNLTSTIAVIPNNFTLNGQTYYFNDTTPTIYYLGADFCPYCASLGYDIYYNLNQKLPPSYQTAPNDYMLAEGNIPALLPQIEWGLPINNNEMAGEVDNATFYGWEMPISTTQLAQAISSGNETAIRATELSVISNMTPQAQYLFSAQQFNFPQLYVVKTIGNSTEVCNSYAGILLYQYNATDATNFASYNMTGIPLGTILIQPAAENYNYNLFANCLKKLTSDG
ncbi:MAG: hypothetical protein QXI16_06875 [Sulfolobaceae archaeon]